MAVVAEVEEAEEVVMIATPVESQKLSWVVVVQLLPGGRLLSRERGNIFLSLHL